MIDSKLKNLFVLFVKPLTTCGYVLYVGMLAVEGETHIFLHQPLCVFAETSKFGSMNKLQNQLEKVEFVTQDLEEGLEFLFRHLINTGGIVRSCGCPINSSADPVATTEGE
ncbi:hypothetical protein JHK82_025123 [Glycine max]|nr:hypothetical protein JHK82_025123 [Glycine max]